MTRPRGAIRQALANAAWSLAHERMTLDRPAGTTWREAAVRAQVGFGAAQQTFKDMARAGELRAVGQVRVEHSCRPMTLWQPAEMTASGSGTDALVAAVRSWAGGK